MATGLEALGAASAVLQVISFTHEVISVCKKVYDGKPTADDDLEDYAKEMSDAVVRVQTRCQAMKTSQQSEADKKLGKVANDCQICARELQDEVRFVTDMHKKGNIIKAVKAVLRASSHRKKLDRLELALFRHRQVMETEMLSLLCSRSDAQKLQHEQIFDKLDQDVQTLVAKISQGHTKLEDLVRNEHSATREVIVLETAKAQETINAHIATETQRKEFIKSLRFPEIKKRYNDLMDSREASFHRVFASYEKMTGSDEDDLEASENGNIARGDIDQAWAMFVEWLKSSVPLFCIQGKPGSGKSTLVKYIVDNKNTRQILCQHAQGTTILSHFFWKIGTSSQNSIKGLLCSLIYQMLVDDQDMLEFVLNRQGSGSYSHYHDWSVNELKSVIECILEVRTYPLCIFVDGLDEICNADGLFKLTQLIEDVLATPRIKICVASRPETLVLNWLEKHNVQDILLEDLTRPDMRSYVLKELEPSLLDRTISDRTYGKLTERLVRKSQGVFLWLYLALRSIIAGIRNQDTEEILLARLEELPGELEDLYADMWKRLNEDNSIYRKAAAKYFQYMLQSHRELCLGWQGASYNTKAFEFAQPILCQLACAESTEIQESLLNADNTIDLVKAQRLCDETKRAIQSRCAGLLQVRSLRDFR